MIAAGLDGIDRKLDPGPPQKHQFVRAVARTAEPQGYQAAAAICCTRPIDALEADPVICRPGWARIWRASSFA
jgi:glutamine synthetase